MPFRKGLWSGRGVGLGPSGALRSISLIRYQAGEVARTTVEPAADKGDDRGLPEPSPTTASRSHVGRDASLVA